MVAPSYKLLTILYNNILVVYNHHMWFIQDKLVYKPHEYYSYIYIYHEP